MTDIELTKRTAEKCGVWVGLVELNRFDPLRDMNDLMNVVLRKLPDNYVIIIQPYRNIFNIDKRDNAKYRKTGSYPADFARAVCTVLVEVDDEKG